jgi:hypothetical protein
MVKYHNLLVYIAHLYHNIVVDTIIVVAEWSVGSYSSWMRSPMERRDHDRSDEGWYDPRTIVIHHHKGVDIARKYQWQNFHHVQLLLSLWMAGDTVSVSENRWIDCSSPMSHYWNYVVYHAFVFEYHYYYHNSIDDDDDDHCWNLVHVVGW